MDDALGLASKQLAAESFAKKQNRAKYKVIYEEMRTDLHTLAPEKSILFLQQKVAKDAEQIKAESTEIHGKVKKTKSLNSYISIQIIVADSSPIKVVNYVSPKAITVKEILHATRVPYDQKEIVMGSIKENANLTIENAGVAVPELERIVYSSCAIVLKNKMEAA